MGHDHRTRYSPADTKRPVVAGSGPRHQWASLIGLGTATAFAWAAGWAWRHIDRVEVSGQSMLPVLQPGDRVVVWKTASVHPGDIVAASDPRQPGRALLKRAAEIGPGGVVLLGDNPGQSTDSRQFGPVPAASLQGKAVYRYAPPARAGRLA
jgi:nickel-type superoxide dismutase maturation protease